MLYWPPAEMLVAFYLLKNNDYFQYFSWQKVAIVISLLTQLAFLFLLIALFTSRFKSAIFQKVDGFFHLVKVADFCNILLDKTVTFWYYSFRSEQFKFWLGIAFLQYMMTSSLLDESLVGFLLSYRGHFRYSKNISSFYRKTLDNLNFS